MLVCTYTGRCLAAQTIGSWASCYVQLISCVCVVKAPEADWIS